MRQPSGSPYRGPPPRRRPIAPLGWVLALGPFRAKVCNSRFRIAPLQRVIGDLRSRRTFRLLRTMRMDPALELTAAYDDLEHTGVAAIAGATRCVLAV